MRSRILVGLLAGAIGGFLGWLLQESLIPYSVVRNALTGAWEIVELTARQAVTLVLCVGGLIGLFLGSVDGIVEGNRRKLWQGMAIGFGAGVLLGYFGFAAGNALYEMLGGTGTTRTGDSIFAFAQQVIARTFGWALMGLGLGIGSAISTRSRKRIFHGAIGGFAGGFVGGFIFDLVAGLQQPLQILASGSEARDGGGPSRLIGFTAIGAFTGCFIGIVEELLKEAWVKVLAGKNEGKDFILSKPLNILGRDERCDVPLYGDASVGAQHAAIRADGNRHTLLDGKTPLGTVVNGQRVPEGGELLLRDGDMIQIGAHRILFREKATASKLARPAADTPRAKPGVPAGIPIPSHLCPFCGSPRDALGNCQCSLVPGAAQGGGQAGAMSGGYGGATAGSSAPVGTGRGAAPGGGSDMPRLVGIEGPYTGEIFLLVGQSVALGREPGRDIVLGADATVSRNHARIANENGDMVIYDTGSANGTYVNGMRVTMQVLAPGDIIQLGNASKFRYE